MFRLSSDIKGDWIKRKLWQQAAVFHNTIVQQRQGNGWEYFWLVFECTLKKKEQLESSLGFVEKSLWASWEGWHRVSFAAGPGLVALTASCVGVLICYTGVGWIWNHFEEFIIFQHALVRKTEGTCVNFTTKLQTVTTENNIVLYTSQLLAYTIYYNSTYFTWSILTVRFCISSEKAPICLTVPSESSICATISSLFSRLLTLIK